MDQRTQKKTRKHEQPLRKFGKQKPKQKPEPKQMYRVEGIGRRGAIRYVKVIGRRGLWTIRGMDGLHFQVAAETVQEAVRRARKRIPFRPVVIRFVSADGSLGADVGTALPLPAVKPTTP